MFVLWLPRHSPELNLIDGGMWGYLAWSAVSNYLFGDIDTLEHTLLKPSAACSSTRRRHSRWRTDALRDHLRPHSLDVHRLADQRGARREPVHIMMQCKLALTKRRNVCMPCSVRASLAFSSE